MRNWIYPETDKVLLKKLSEDKDLYGISPLILEFCINKGYHTANEILDLLYENNYLHHDFTLFKDGEKALAILQHAYEEKWETVIMSDYDSDGAHGAAVGVTALRKAGINAHYYTNNRFTQGYGMQISSVDEILARYPKTRLIITCDNGIVAYEAVEYAKSKGLFVIITDHHNPSEKLPFADAIIDAKQKDCTYPFKELCGAGVMYKFVEAFYQRNRLPLQVLQPLIELVAVATVGDIVPLVGENRLFVKKGLSRLNQADCHPIYRFMKEIAGVEHVTADFTIGFVFVPMINARGRLKGDINPVIEAFICEDEKKQRAIVEELKELNDLRKEMTETQMATALELLEQKEELPKVIVLAHESFHEGIIGLIAGRLKEKHNRPTFVFGCTEQGTYKGSGRSVEAFHIKNAFEHKWVSPTIIQGGGHHKAGGVSIEKHQLEAFEKAVNRLADEWMTEEDLIPVDIIDMVITEDDLTYELIHDLAFLEPFGEGFKKPTLLLKNFIVKQKQPMGKEKNHLRLSSEHLNVIMWGEAQNYLEQGQPTRLDICGYPQINVYNNTTSIQFVANNGNYKVAE